SSSIPGPAPGTAAVAFTSGVPDSGSHGSPRRGGRAPAPAAAGCGGGAARRGAGRARGRRGGPSPGEAQIRPPAAALYIGGTWTGRRNAAGSPLPGRALRWDEGPQGAGVDITQVAPRTARAGDRRRRRPRGFVRVL